MLVRSRCCEWRQRCTELVSGAPSGRLWKHAPRHVFLARTPALAAHGVEELLLRGVHPRAVCAQGLCSAKPPARQAARRASAPEAPAWCCGRVSPMGMLERVRVVGSAMLCGAACSQRRGANGGGARQTAQTRSAHTAGLVPASVTLAPAGSCWGSPRPGQRRLAAPRQPAPPPASPHGWATTFCTRPRRYEAAVRPRWCDVPRPSQRIAARRAQEGRR